MTGCSPIRGAIEVAGPGAGRPRITMRVGADEPILAGHFPGLPIFPGVAVVEFVRRGALATLAEPSRPGRRWVLSGIGSVRFLAPVFPGDILTADLSWSGEGTTRRCAASVTTGRGEVARAKLTFTERGAA